MSTATKTPTVNPIDYAGWDEHQLAAPGPDLPSPPQMLKDIDEHPRNRWGVAPLPAALMPVQAARAAWRLDRFLELAQDTQARATACNEDTTLDDKARAADLAAVVAGKPAHRLAELEAERISLNAAARDLARMTQDLENTARGILIRIGEGDDSDLPTLMPYLRERAGKQIAAYLDALTTALAMRNEAVASALRLADWWRHAAYPTGYPQSYDDAFINELPTITADAVGFTFDTVHNPTAVTFHPQKFLDAERRALAALAQNPPAPGKEPRRQVGGAELGHGWRL